MNLVTITIPEEFAKNTLIVELNSYAYYEEYKALVYLKGFGYDEEANVKADVENYALEDENIIKYFTKDNPTVTGMKNIDCDGLSVKEMNDIVLILMNFCANHSSINTSAPVFNTGESVENHQTTTKNYDVQDNDILINIPKDPVKFDANEEGLEEDGIK